jgi:Type II CAAX prenyl endopeptidase Rce1-like
VTSAGGNMPLTNDSEQNYTASAEGSGLIFFITLLTFEVPITFNLGQLFIVLWTIYLVLFAVAMNGPIRNIISAIRASTTRGLVALFDNSMLVTLIVFPIVVWVTVAISLVEAAGGVSTGSLPPTDPLLEFVELTLAPLREELGFRVIPIGIVALGILFSSGRLRDGLMALWHPSRYLKKNDSPEAYARHLKYIYIAIGISALLFGLAHVLLGAGWGAGKILSAAVAGVGLGGLYYLYGFPAAVLLHWSIDYFLSLFDLNASLQSAGGAITFYTLALSFAGAVVLILVVLRTFRNRKLGLSSGTWFGRS